MAKPLKICSKCLAALRNTTDGEEDLASFLMGIGAGGVELVAAESCEARIIRHNETVQTKSSGRSLADVTEQELESSIKALITQLRLPAGRSGEAWDLENAIRAEWLKAMEARKREQPEQ